MTETIHETWDDARVIADLLFAATTGANRLQQTAAIDEAVRFIRALMAQRTRQEERVRVLEEALREIERLYWVEGADASWRAAQMNGIARNVLNARAALGNGGSDA